MPAAPIADIYIEEKICVIDKFYKTGELFDSEDEQEWTKRLKKSRLYESESSDLSIPTITINKDIKESIDLGHITEAIYESKYILTLENNWDEEGAIKPPSAIYQRAINFVKKYSEFVKRNYEVIVVAPDISPLKDGSIDLNWTSENGNLLINVKNIEENIGYYYGEAYEKGKKIFDVNGKISLDDVINTFAAWFIYLPQMENQEN